MERNSKNKKILFLCILPGLFIVAASVLALETQWPASPAGTQLNDSVSLAGMVKYFYEWGIAIGGLAAFFALVMAGFQYLTSAGDPSKMKDATGKIKSAILGLVLLLTSYLFLNLINPELTTLRMPSFDEISDTDSILAPITVEPPDMTSICKEVTVYSQPNYSDLLATITKDNPTTNVWVSKASGSIKIEGTCKVELYSISNCARIGDEPMSMINCSYSDIGDLYLPRDIRCIAIDKLEFYSDPQSIFPLD